MRKLNLGVTDGPPALKEAQFQALVMQAADQLGWLCYHVHDSRFSETGFPDLVALKGGRCIVAELKKAGEKLRPGRWQGKRWLPGQDEWLEAFKAVGTIEVYVWRPEDWEALKKVLGGE